MGRCISDYACDLLYGVKEVDVVFDFFFSELLTLPAAFYDCISCCLVNFFMVVFACVSSKWSCFACVLNLGTNESLVGNLW